MNTINNIGAADPIQRLNTTPLSKSALTDAPTTTLQRAPDSVDFSGAGYLQSLQANNIRTDLVSSVKAQIAAGTYESNDKLNVAADKLLDDLNS